MGDVAQFKHFGPFWYGGSLVTAPRLFHYIAGSSTLKNAWIDEGKNDTAAQPIVGDANGQVSAYFDGLYKLVVTLSDGTTVVATWDDVDITQVQHRFEGALLWDPGSLADGAGETSPAITVTGAALGDYVLVAAVYDLQGITATAYVSANATVRIRLQNETGGAIDLGSTTWQVRVLQL